MLEEAEEGFFGAFELLLLLLGFEALEGEGELSGEDGEEGFVFAAGGHAPKTMAQEEDAVAAFAAADREEEGALDA